jgi:WbqC-like protein
MLCISKLKVAQMSLRVAIMQPYFFPYAGYFNLFAAVDVFVVLDCVQFPRRGYVHRNQISDRQNTPQWLTLPLQKAERDTTRICDLQFALLARELMLEQFRRFPCLIKLDQTAPDLFRSILDFERSPVAYLVENLRNITRLLGFERSMVLSSSLNVSSDLKAQARIIEIARRVGARHYVNASGGRGIYEAEAFGGAGLTLNFLSDHQGSFKSILERVLTEEIGSIVGELRRNMDIEFEST